jgi:hypothetical protein
MARFSAEDRPETEQSGVEGCFEFGKFNPHALSGTSP